MSRILFIYSGSKQSAPLKLADLSNTTVTKLVQYSIIFKGDKKG